jgi:hypothetical protein
MSERITHNVDATRLLNLAQQIAVGELTGERGHIPATSEALVEFARLVRAAVLCQVELGLWRQFGVQTDEAAKLEPLVVRVDLGNPLLGEPPVKVVYDFKRTALPLLVVRTTKDALSKGSRQDVQ